MSKRTRVAPRAERARCGARLPSPGTARLPASRPMTDSIRRSGRRTAGEWLLLPDGTWRRVETIRVPTLFG
ncbi:hypothetical protein ACFV8Z_17160 [Streptomyces sp. NPDC059837]|uniref:hypothetical protein n=1 Tax=unclassified Streptomyces TaxID=2593676 RepID=UPI002258ADE4|nr:MULTISPECIES: hypothetical protein [unclassified Streptomyces]MCX4404569.1 hypothetical protein [Streptomyces sp. NBC_01764]MCX5190892.1 hypothetical protein [Streptomyces sp. NBC_00268]